MFQILPLETWIERELAVPKAIAVLAGVLGLLGLTIALMGVSTSAILAAMEKRREYGIRLALGASRMDIVRLSMRTGLAIAATGSLLGESSGPAIYLIQVTPRCSVRAGVEDYPRNLAEFERRFATQQACRAYLEQLRWSEGFRCPRCDGTKAWRVRERWWQCAGCAHQTSVTAGTIFQDTRTPLPTWFRAMWWVTNQKSGVSALGLQRALGLGSYKTAWTWLHKLRRAMVRPGRDRLTGRVEVDETHWGAAEAGAWGRRKLNKVLIAVAVEQVGRRGLGRIRMRQIPDASADSLQGFVGEAITPGSLIHTDGWVGYDRLEQSGYGHRITFVKGQRESAADLLPRVHQVVSLLKRWLLGTHHGAVSFDHLDYYLDEFTFRFNRRTSRARGKLFYRLAQQAVAVAPVPYKNLIMPDHNM